MQKAEYQNRKKGMGCWTEEERSTGGTAVRGKREEGKRKNGRLSSQNQEDADGKKAEVKGKAQKTEGKHWWNGCGSETRKDERKQTESRVLKNGRETRETG